MRILIFGEAILPPAYLPRVRYFCSYFMEKGWQVDWIIENSDFSAYAPKNVSTLFIEYYKNKKGILGKIEWLIKFLLNLIWDHKGRYFHKKSARFLADKNYDLVFCSSSFTFPLTTAERAAKKMNVPLFVDLRDIAEQSPDDNHYLAHKPPTFLGNFIIRIYKKISLKRRNRVLKAAAGVTTVSPWHVQTLSRYNPNTHLIYNGFDENLFIPEDIDTERFTVSYFGRIYNDEMRNPRLLFSAIQKLYEKGVMTPQNTVVKWFVDEVSKNVVQQIGNDYALNDFMEFHPFVIPEKLTDEMNKSSILLVLCNVTTSKKYFGIMTTKFFEAIGANRPVLCIPDNQDNLSEFIKETGAGMVSSDASEVERFLYAEFLEWQKNGRTAGKLSNETRMKFSRKQSTAILEQLFLKAIKKQG